MEKQFANTQNSNWSKSIKKYTATTRNNVELKNNIKFRKGGKSQERYKGGMQNVPEKNLESMDNIMNGENQMTNFYNHNHKDNDSASAKNFDQNFATNSFMKSFCNDDSL